MTDGEGGPRSIRVGTWNVAWKHPSRSAGRTMRERLLAEDPEVLCITEADADFMGADGHTICAEADYGYPLKGNRRKVLLWSGEPWTSCDRIGDPALPRGRFVAGRTTTKAGPLLVVGVCIPWAAAHVSTGRRDKKRWEDHLAYLAGLQTYLSKLEEPFLLMGDFNQAVPRRAAPRHVFDALERAILNQVEIFTSGDVKPCGFSIDHIAGSRGLTCTLRKGLSAVGPEGAVLSDHFGIIADLKPRQHGLD